MPETIMETEGKTPSSEGKKPLYTSSEPEKSSGLPKLYADDLVFHDEDDEEVGHEVQFGLDSWVIAFTGIRGSGKSLSMAFTIAHALAAGLQVWSNMSVSFRCIYPDGSEKDLSTYPLDFNALYNLNKELQSGLVAIDEIQYYVDSRISNSLRNRMVNAAIRQVRKRTLSFLYTTRSLDWIDKRLRNWETDVEFQCWDMHKSNPSEFKRGEYITMSAFDQSGAWTGQPWYPKEEPTGRYGINMANRIWPIYSTEEIIDYFEATAPLRINRSGSQDPEEAERNMTLIQELILDYRLKDENEASADRFRERLSHEYGVSMDDKPLGKILSGLGAVRHRGRAGSTYDLSKIELSQ